MSEPQAKPAQSLSDRYSPAEVETRIYKWWEDAGYFKADDLSQKPPFSIILPPPNVTGQLHMGHALDHTIQDVLIRWKRMSGFNTMWLPGLDHAGIATQSVVERELKKEGLNRHALGRDEFVKRVWQWKEQYGGRIFDQMRRLGDSCDWDRAVFTLDEGVSKAVRKVFVDLYRRKLIYRGKKLINWSAPLETAISDLEVEHKEIKGSLYHIAYPVVGVSDAVIVVATTRPETLLGDVAVAVHPEDSRYQSFIGKELSLPLTDRKIPVIADAAVEKDFGSGAVKITPAHDFNDYQMGLRHKLDVINILNKNGTLNENAGRFAGLKVQEARKQVIQALKECQALIKEEPHTHSVGFCSRSGAVVEPFLSEQWFARMAPISTAARHVVENESLRFEPQNWTKTYLHWMSILEDWCISRQLWWGHRIPAWTCESCGHVTVSESEPTRCEKCQSTSLVQDPDVLDTWFSSALWPFSTMGWPSEDTQSLEVQKTFYPTDVLVTGHDIIFFWVARMIMMGMEFKRDLPFRKVYIHGLVRDADGKKMSKSSGTALDPVDLIDRHGADALRFTLMAQIATGRDLKFSETRLEGYRNFMNKIWNASRFALAALEDFEVPPEGTRAVPPKSDLSVADQWIVFQTGQLEKAVDEALQTDRYSDAANAIYHFVWNEFCDWYLEFIKPTLYSEAAQTEEPARAERKATQLVLAQTLNRIVRLLHPFAPFISEEIYQKLPIRNRACIIDQFPTLKNDKDWVAQGSAEAAQEMQCVMAVVSAIRNIRGELGIKPGVSIRVKLAPSDDRAQKILGENRASIIRFAKTEDLEIGPVASMAKCAVSPVRVGSSAIDVIVPLEGLVDLTEEVKRLEKAMEKNQKDIQVLSQKLANENFVKNAPEELIQADRLLLEAAREKQTRMSEALTRLSQA